MTWWRACCSAAAGTTPTPAAGPRTSATTRPGTTTWSRSRSTCRPRRLARGLPATETARRSGSGSGRASSTSSPPGRRRRSCRRASPRWWWSPPRRKAQAMDARQLAAACLARLGELFPAARVVIGIGGTCRDPRDVRAPTRRRSHHPAPGAPRPHRGGLGVRRPRHPAAAAPGPRPGRAALLRRRRAGQAQHARTRAQSEYLATLACYFRENNSPQRASRILHVHPNTVAYRVKRIEEITGLRLDDYTDRLIAQVALEILDSLGDEP